MALHVLGVLAAEDDDALAALVATAGSPDPSFQRTVSSSAVNELGGLGSRAGGAVPTLIRLLEPCDPPDPLDLRRASAVTALGRLGPVAGAAIPRLARVATDRRDACRLEAVDSLGEIAVGLHPPEGLADQPVGGKAEPTPSLTLVVRVLRSLREDQDPALRESVGWQLRRLVPRVLAKLR